MQHQLVTTVACVVVLLASEALVSEAQEAGTVVDAHDDHDHEEEAFHQLAEMMQATNPEAGLDVNATRNWLRGLGEECLNASQLFSYLGANEIDDVITEDMFTDASVVTSYFLRRSNCTELSVSDAHGQLNSTQLCRSSVQSLLNDIAIVDRVPVNESLQCFSSADVMEEACADQEEEITQAFALMFIELLEGRCVLPTTDHFVDEVFELYHSEDENELHEPDLSRLLSDLNIGSSSVAAGGDGTDHEGHDHARKRRQAEEADHDEHGHEETKCYSVDELLSMGGYETNVEGEKVLSKAGFQDICPAIVHQIVSNSCVTADEHTETGSNATSTYTLAQKYGYGTVAVLVISLLAFIGLLLFHSIGSHSFQLTMQFFIALGIGTLSGDALLHLIPEVVGLHSHGGHEAEGGHEDHEDEDKTYLWRLLVVVGGIYLFYLFENILKLWNRASGSKIKFQNHNHGCSAHTDKDGDRINGHHMTNLAVVSGTNDVRTPSEEVKANGKKYLEAENGSASKEKFCGASPVALMVFIGDALHNFGDGIAIGAAFSSSWVSGLGTSIAIFCHELPHEFGDFAIYLKSGMTKWRALFLNFGAACCCFIGLYIGLSIGEYAGAREWLLAVIAGMFLYIALVDIMHEMIEERSDSPMLQFLMQNLGLLLGWAILLLLAFYEDQLLEALS